MRSLSFAIPHVEIYFQKMLLQKKLLKGSMALFIFFHVEVLTLITEQIAPEQKAKFRKDDFHMKMRSWHCSEMGRATLDEFREFMKKMNL